MKTKISTDYLRLCSFVLIALFCLSSVFNFAHAEERKISPQYLLQADSFPDLSFPWPEGEAWNFLGGPHRENAALDFEPIEYRGKGCGTDGGLVATDKYVVAAADGVMVKPFGEYKDGGYFLQIDHDLNHSDGGDGNLTTGWQTIYGHIANPLKDAGQIVHQGDRLGNPSCLGGSANTVHVHFAIRYRNSYQSIVGRSISGWQVTKDGTDYEGQLYLLNFSG